MGKKVKVGKARKDKFYELAKTEGYRSRAAYKLLQLDGKFNFLSNTTVCIDLCAAPGGWLQAARKRMPVSSIIIGVDLEKIRPIPNVQTFVEDIRTNECRQTIRNVLHDRKANVVLHDGAPNVGKNWLHDAYNQSELTLSALKLATVFLARGGYFVTKVFRSKDYNALLWVFLQMFKSVHSTKPQASRNESAEIFVVCQGYLAPDKIDPKFFESAFVFKDVDPEPKKLLNLVHPEKQNRKADGYAEGEIILEHRLNALKFITDENYLELLQNSTEIVLDDDRITNHSATTDEIKECLKDLRVLGKKDIRNVLTWHKRVKKFLAESDPSLQQTVAEMKEEDSEEEDEEEAELKETDDLIAKKHEERDKELKRKKKLALKEKRKLQHKLKLNMVIPGDRIDAVDDIELFNLKTIKLQQQREQLVNVSDQESIPDDSDHESIPDDSDHESIPDASDHESIPDDSDEGKDLGVADVCDEDVEEANNNKLPESEDGKKNHVDYSSSDDSCSDDDDDISNKDSNNYRDNRGSAVNQSQQKKDGFEIVPRESNAKKIKLNPYELAVGEEIIRSQKRRREIIEMSYNRYVSNDDGLPDWFMKDEKLHCRKQTPVTKEQIQMYKERQKAIDAQPIKKIAEAKARRKHKLEKRLEKARKKAETVTDSIEMSEREKMKAAKEIYKRAGLLRKEKRKLTYVVAKKHTASGKRVSRPDGVKGHYRVVDPRQKKDKRKQKVAGKKWKKGKKGPAGRAGKQK